MTNLDKKREQLDIFFKSHTRLQYKKGETIIRPEDDPSGVFLIEWGFVKAYSMTKYGEENLLLVRTAGSIFPLIWAFTGEHGNTCYEAMEPSSLWRVSRSDYLEYMEQNPSLLPVILDKSLDGYRLHSERVKTLCYRTARERVMSFLVGSADRFGIHNSDGSITINAPYKQSDIASAVNATRETTSREINALKNKGLLTTRDGLITVMDLEKLKSAL